MGSRRTKGGVSQLLSCVFCVLFYFFSRVSKCSLRWFCFSRKNVLKFDYSHTWVFAPVWCMQITQCWVDFSGSASLYPPTIDTVSSHFIANELINQAMFLKKYKCNLEVFLLNGLKSISCNFARGHKSAFHSCLRSIIVVFFFIDAQFFTWSEWVTWPCTSRPLLVKVKKSVSATLCHLYTYV